METSEIRSPDRPRPSARRWLDLAVSVAALVTSVSSIVIALQNSSSMDRLVAANSWPFPVLVNSNFENSVPEVSIALRNSGSGPAKIESFSIFYDGQPMQSWPDILRACCLAPGAGATEQDLIRATDGAVVSGQPAGQVLLPGDRATILKLRRTEGNEALWRELDAARFKMRFAVCYCSVFDDCWTSTLATTRPTPVKVCPRADKGYSG